LIQPSCCSSDEQSLFSSSSFLPKLIFGPCFFMWWKARPKAFLSQLFRLPSMCTLRLERQYLRCRYPLYSLRCTSSNRTSTPVIEIAFFRSLFFFESSLFVSDKESQAFYCSHCTACLHKHHLVKRIERIVYVSLFFENLF